MILVLKAWSEACVVASCEPVWGFLVLLWPKDVRSTSKWQHIWFWVEAEGRWTREVFISSARGMSWGLPATQSHSTHLREINQSLDEQDCHFLCECWKISSAVNLSLLCLCLLSASHKWWKVQPVEFFSTMNHSEAVRVQLDMFILIGRFNSSSEVRCASVLVQACCYT